MKVCDKDHIVIWQRDDWVYFKSETGNVVGIEGAYNSYLGGVEGIMRMQKLSGIYGCLLMNQ